MHQKYLEDLTKTQIAAPVRLGWSPRKLIFKNFPSDANIVMLIFWEPVPYIKGFHEDKVYNIRWLLLIWISGSARVPTLFDEQVNSTSASQLVASLSLRKPKMLQNYQSLVFKVYPRLHPGEQWNSMSDASSLTKAKAWNKSPILTFPHCCLILWKIMQDMVKSRTPSERSQQNRQQRH